MQNTLPEESLQKLNSLVNLINYHVMHDGTIWLFPTFLLCIGIHTKFELKWVYSESRAYSSDGIQT